MRKKRKCSACVDKLKSIVGQINSDSKVYMYGFSINTLTFGFITKQVITIVDKSPSSRLYRQQFSLYQILLLWFILSGKNQLCGHGFSMRNKGLNKVKLAS